MIKKHYNQIVVDELELLLKTKGAEKDKAWRDAISSFTSEIEPPDYEEVTIRYDGTLNGVMFGYGAKVSLGESLKDELLNFVDTIESKRNQVLEHSSEESAEK